MTDQLNPISYDQTSLIQPMDQDVLKCMKRIYRKSLLRDLIAQGGDNMITYLNGLYMLNVVERISTTWKQISPETIRKSWNKLIPVPDAANVDIMPSENINEQFVNAFAALNIVSGDDIDSWLAEDGPGYEHLDVNGIVDMMNSEDPDDINEEEEISEDDISQPCPVSHKKAMAMFEKCLIWLRHQPEATVGKTSTLVMLRELAVEKREATGKQSDIRSFFS